MTRRTNKTFEVDTVVTCLTILEVNITKAYHKNVITYTTQHTHKDDPDQPNEPCMKVTTIEDPGLRVRIKRGSGQYCKACFVPGPKKGYKKPKRIAVETPTSEPCMTAPPRHRHTWLWCDRSSIRFPNGR